MKFSPKILLSIVLLILFKFTSLHGLKYGIENEDKYLFDYDLYHTTDALFKEVDSLLKSCKVIKETRFKQIASEEDKKTAKNNLLEDLRYYDFEDTSIKEKTEKAYILTGEHPREMIAPEVVLRFMKNVCTKGSKESELLKRFKLRVVLNVNPVGRRKVEKGDLCNRGNGNLVDLNRNWDFNWGKDVPKGMSEENPGLKAFSETETRFIKETVKKYNPLVFLSIHSGIFGLFHPYAFEGANDKINDKELANIKAMHTVLDEVKKKNCSTCFVGKPKEHLGYNSSGTCIDYIFREFGVKYSMAWEVYTNEVKWKELESFRKDFNAKKKALFLQKSSADFEPKDSGKNLRKNKQQESLSSKRVLLEDPSNKIIKSPPFFVDSMNNGCITLFNPLDTAGYNFVVKNWSDALVTLLNSVYKNHNEKQ